jgi:calcineurin-like phosphoesterase family protein
VSLTAADQAIILAKRHEGWTADHIAMDYGMNREEVRAFVRSIDDEIKVPTPVYFDNPIRPLGVPMPEICEVNQSRETQTALIYGDSHFPYQDNAVLDIVRQISQDLKPDTIIHIGDLVDCYPISDYDRNPHRRFNLQDEINQARQHLATMRLYNPQAVFHLFEGNHEDRLRRLLWRMKGPSAELLQLDIVKTGLTWPALLGLPELGIQFYAYDGAQAFSRVLPKFTVIHGNLVRKFGGYSARGEMEKYGTSGASGHSHRLGLTAHRKLDGAYIWIETGCTCKLEAEYVQNPDWQAGCVVMTFDNQTGAPSAEPVYCHNGLAVWRGTTYRSTV